MNKNTQEVIIGSLLGDGWLTPIKSSRGTSSFCVKYHMKSLGYLLWLRAQVKELNPSKLHPTVKHLQYYFYTSVREDIGELREIFYPHGKKIIPYDISDLLTSPKSLAIWYQDDGTLDRRSKYHWNAMFATYCFSFGECELLINALKQNFDLDVSITRCQMRGIVRYRLYILSKSMNRFMEIVKPYIHYEFRYKITNLKW